MQVDLVLRKLAIIAAGLMYLSGCSVQAMTPVYNESHNLNSIEIQPKQKIPSSFIIVPKDVNIVTIGDSLTEGVGDETNNGGYTGILEEKLAEKRKFGTVSLSNYGIMGLRTTDLLTQLQGRSMEESLANADTIIVTIGGNDVMQIVVDNFLDITFDLFEDEQVIYEENLQKILTKIRDINANATILLIGLYNPFDGMIEISAEINTIISNWNEGSRMILSKFDNTEFVTIDEAFRETDESVLSADAFHPNAKGYEIISEKIIETMMSIE